ncbi:MAG: alpha/beta hydrolase [Verrucomicrobiota bacterium]|nr:alpha/beta hydrolase [Verrucomicrobiota bacterium]
MKTLLLGLMCSAVISFAAERNEILLWPKGAPGSEGKTQPEVVQVSDNGEERVYQVHKPSITPYLPSAEKNTGTAVLVIPGGGHRVLVMTHEGYNVGKWLSDRGIAAFVLKHRLARETNSTYKIEVEALQDTQRAIRLIRSRAKEWGIDPEKLGVMGFSAGGELASFASLRFDSGKVDSQDPIEREQSKPAFQALIYPGRSDLIVPTKDSPPAFLAAGFKDRKDISEGLAEVYLRFKRAGVPADLHIYAGAPHGFGLRVTDRSPAGAWPERFVEWLADQKILQSGRFD